jgi:hypothetical protein
MVSGELTASSSVALNWLARGLYLFDPSIVVSLLLTG